VCSPGNLVDTYDINHYSSHMKGDRTRVLMFMADANGHDVHVDNIKNILFVCFHAREGLDQVWPGACQ
jgi:hypothetical protein